MTEEEIINGIDLAIKNCKDYCNGKNIDIMYVSKYVYDIIVPDFKDTGKSVYKGIRVNYTSDLNPGKVEFIINMVSKINL